MSVSWVRFVSGNYLLKENRIITFWSYLRIMSECYVRLTLGNYVIKSWKWDQKITLWLSLEVTSGLRYKNHVRITSEGYVRLALGSYVIKPCK